MRYGIACMPLLVVTIAGSVVGQDSAASKVWRAVYQSVAADFDMRLSDGADTKLDFLSKPLLFWNNKASNRDSHGAFFVWTSDGRPAVISAVWSFNADNRRRIIHEFHSLSPRGLTADHPNGPIPTWTPRVAGVKFVRIPAAAKPGGTAQRRLAQMRKFASDFTGFRTANDGVERTMRMLTTPLHRYAASDSTTTLDGGVFVFFDNWDPELMLVLEARESGSGPLWEWCAARFSDRQLRLEYLGAEVWSCPGQHFGGPTLPYYVRHSSLVFDHKTGERVQ